MFACDEEAVQLDSNHHLTTGQNLFQTVSLDFKFQRYSFQ